MNKVILMGRLTKDPEIRYSAGQNQMTIARYQLAVDRRMKKAGEAAVDFIPCVVFGKQAEFAEKYLKKGTKIVVVGRIQTGSYMNRDGQKVFTTDVVVEEQEFAESKAAATNANGGDDFMGIPDGIDGEIPFR
ncbi:MAG: single-stranded DNA-binding protein [Lachnospiraceae bacterium]|nr:single-stranded DNA-binding protein [Lachnospiraceae bacterium]